MYNIITTISSLISAELVISDISQILSISGPGKFGAVQEWF